MSEITVLQAMHDALRKEMAHDPRIIVLGEDVGVMGGFFHATDGLQKEFGEERVIDTPLAESGLVGVAIGAAINGLRPVAEIQFADFIYPSVDQIISEAAKWRYRTNGAQGCPIVVRSPYGDGTRGGPYHSQNVEAVFFGVPGLKIVTPATPYDTKGLLKAAIRDEDPVLFFEHKRTYRMIKGEVPEGLHRATRQSQDRSSRRAPDGGHVGIDGPLLHGGGGGSSQRRHRRRGARSAHPQADG